MLNNLWRPSRRSLIAGAGAALIARPSIARMKGNSEPPILDFVNASYSGATLASMLSISRASSGYAMNAAGLLVPFSANTLRIASGNGLLIEDPQTNIAIQSNAFPSWATVTGISGAQNIADPAGVANNGWTLTQTGINGAFDEISQFIPILNDSLSYTTSFFIKKQVSVAAYPQINTHLTGGTPDLNSGVVVDPINGVVLVADYTTTKNASIVDAGNYWLVSYTSPNNSTGNTFLTIRVVPAWNSAYSISESTVNGGTAGISFLQIVKNTFPGSYIPTTSGSATRNLDAITITGALLAALQNPTGTIVFTTMGLPGSQLGTLLGFNGAVAGLQIAADNTVKTVWGGGSLATTDTATWSAVNKVALRWNPSGRSIALNGGTIFSDSTVPSPPTSAFLGSMSDGTAALDGFIQRIRVY